ncbi:MAG: ABC transporter permease [Fimbriimonadaceae bacterium]|nr:ABC transporter permease [Fimbriimonadaceae bacterium]
MREEFRELWRFRELLLAMVERELRIRYKNSVLGIAWSLLNPLVTVFVMHFVLKNVMQNGTKSFSLFILAAYLPYMFFQMSILDSAQSVVTALPVVKKVYFPREILPLASVASNAVHFLIALVVYFVYAFGVWAVFGFKDPTVSYRVVFLPVLLVIHFALTTGLSLVFSALNVFYEDVKYMLTITLYLAFFLSPVMYFAETVFEATRKYGALSDVLYKLYMLNPVATLCTVYRKALVAPGDVQVIRDGHAIMVPFQRVDWVMFGVATALSFIALVGGYAFFNRMKWKFVERP